MKKIKFLLFTFIFMFLSIPNVFADWNIISVKKTELSYGNSYKEVTTEAKVFNNIAFRGGYYSPGGSVTKGTFYLNDVTNFLDSTQKYSISFFIWWGSIAYDSTSEGLRDSIPPLVTLDSNSCYVKPLGMDGAGMSSYGTSLFNVVCDEYVPSTAPVVEIYSIANTSTGSQYFGIQNGWGYSVANSELNEIINSTENIESSLGDLNTGVSDLNDNITSSDTNGSQGQANSFFEGFESSDYGLSDIITMPLNLIKGLTSNTCVALSLTIPFVNKTFQLPCMSSIYQQYFGSFYSLYQTITFGFISYWVIVKIFALVKGFKDPDDDKIEVVDL